MSGAGAPETVLPDGSSLKVAIVGTRWHPQITDALVESAARTAKECGVADATVLRVAGALELPVVCQTLARAGYDAIVAVGLVLRGGTPHFDYVCDAFTAGLTRVALDESVPLGNGVLTCDTLEQAQARSGLPGSSEDKGREAMLAALETAQVIRAVRSQGSVG